MYDTNVKKIQGQALRYLDTISAELQNFLPENMLFQKLPKLAIEAGFTSPYMQAAIAGLKQHYNKDANMRRLTLGACRIASYLELTCQDSSILGTFLVLLEYNETPEIKGSGCIEGYRNRLWIGLMSMLRYMPDNLESSANINKLCYLLAQNLPQSYL
jgi:hypothetical protein